MQVFNSGNYNTEEVRKTVIGLARDIRGIAFAFNTKVYVSMTSTIFLLICVILSNKSMSRFYFNFIWTFIFNSKNNIYLIIDVAYLFFLLDKLHDAV